MIITDISFSRCPAICKVFYTDDSGENKYAYAYGLSVCYTCADYTLMRIAEEGERNDV